MIKIITILLAIIAPTMAASKKVLKEIDMMDDIKFTAGSTAGQILLANAIKVKNDEMQEREEMESLEAKAQTQIASRRLEDTFQAAVQDHSILFQSCHNTTGYTPNGGWGTYSYVYFTLCPTAYCRSSGCKSSSYGDYMVSTQTFIDAYLESKLQSKEARCENMRETCGCQQGEEDDDCMYYCYLTFDDDEFTWADCKEEANQMAQFGECAALEIENDDDGRRQLGGDDDQEYFVGPVCGKTGKYLYLAVYLDDECLYPAPYNTYETLSGSSEPMPYSVKSGNPIVKQECLSCKEEQNPYAQQDDDAADADAVSQFCEEAIDMSFARCEDNLALDMDDDAWARRYENGYCNCDCVSEILSTGSTQVSSESSSSAYQLSSPFSSSSSSSSTSSGATAGAATSVVLGMLCAVLLIVGGTFYYYKQKTASQSSEGDDKAMNFELQQQR